MPPPPLADLHHEWGWEGMRLLVCGSRSFQDRNLMEITLNALHSEHSFAALIHGACQGADLLAASWAFRNGLRVMPYVPEWRLHGKAAGAVRNIRMLREGNPGLVVAFVDRPLAESRGTADLVGRAERIGVPVIVRRGLGAWL